MNIERLRAVCTPEKLKLLAPSEREFLLHCLHSWENRNVEGGEKIEQFCIANLPHYFTRECSFIHREIYKDIFELLQQDPYGKTFEKGFGAAMPREHGKTTTISVGAMLNIIYRWKEYPFFADRDQPPFIVIASDTYRQALRRVDELKREIEQNENLLRNYGPQVGHEHWSKSFFVTKSGVIVLAVSKGGAVRGEMFKAKRPSVIVIDDIDNDKAVRSMEQRGYTHNWIDKVLLPLGSKAVVFALGTIIHRDCVIGRFSSEKKDQDGQVIYYPDFRKRKYAAEYVDKDGQRRATWPQEFTLERLDKIKKVVGTIAYNSEYMNDPIDEDTSLFPMSWLEPCKTTKRVVLTAAPPKGKYLAIFQSWDLAIIDDPKKAARMNTDYTVGLSIGITPEFTWDVLRLVRRRGLSPIQTLDFIEEEAVILHPDESVDFFQPVEINSFGHLIYAGLKERGTIASTVIPHTTDGRKHSVFEGLPSLSVAFENGIISFPYGDQRSRQQMDILINELNGFGSEPHDDTVMALYIFLVSYRKWLRRRLKMAKIKEIDPSKPMSIQQMGKELPDNVKSFLPETWGDTAPKSAG